MKYSLKMIIAVLFVLSCTKAEKKLKAEPLPILLKMGYYPTFHAPAETILNLDEKYILFYSPTKYSHEPPPPPNLVHNLSLEQQKENYQKYLQETPELKPFKADLSKTDIDRIKRVLKSFSNADFVDKEAIASLDGMMLNFVILYSNGILKQINPLNTANAKQAELSQAVLDLLTEKNSNKNDSIILQKLKGYR